jgi:hypothetical protein
MAQGYKFKSFIRTLAPGQPYHDAAEALNTLGAAGWELVSIVVVRAGLQNQWAEIFYLQMRDVVVDTALPADSPPPNSPP